MIERIILNQNWQVSYEQFSNLLKLEVDALSQPQVLFCIWIVHYYSVNVDAGTK